MAQPQEIVYKTLVRSILEYTATIWDPYTESEVSTTENVQHRVA